MSAKATAISTKAYSLTGIGALVAAILHHLARQRLTQRPAQSRTGSSIRRSVPYLPSTEKASSALPCSPPYPASTKIIPSAMVGPGAPMDPPCALMPLTLSKSRTVSKSQRTVPSVASCALRWPSCEPHEDHTRIVGGVNCAGCNRDLYAIDNGDVLLHFAALKGRKEVVGLLLTNKCDVNAKDKDGLSALMLAANGGFAEVVESLLEAKADVNARARKGSQTAL